MNEHPKIPVQRTEGASSPASPTPGEPDPSEDRGTAQEWEARRRARERVADERDARADARDAAADESEAEADRRQADADRREQLADAREVRADIREHAWDDLARAGGVPRVEVFERAHAALDRAAEALARAEQRLQRTREALQRFRRRSVRDQDEIDRESATVARAIAAGNDARSLIPILAPKAHDPSAGADRRAGQADAAASERGDIPPRAPRRDGG